MLDRTKAPDVFSFEERPIPAENVKRLDNGLVFHYYSGGDQPVGNLRILFKGGAFDGFRSAIPRIATDLLVEGSKSYSGETIADILDFNGARFAAKVSTHHSGVEVLFLNSSFSAISPVLKSILTEPLFDEHSFATIRQRAVSNQQMNRAKVAFLASSEFNKMIYGPNHPAAQSPAPEEIEAISLSDITSFHTRLVNANGAHAYLSGKLSERLITEVETLLESLPCSDSTFNLNIVPYSTQAPCCIYTRKNGSLQSAICAGIPAIERRNPDYIPLRLSIMALGGYFGSRLMSNIREEKGLTYGISAYLSGGHEGSHLQIEAQCDNTTAEIVVDEIRNELSKLASNPPQGDELRRLKLNASTSLVEVLDSPFAIMAYYTTALTADIPEGYFKAQQTAISALTAETIAEMAFKYLNPDLLRISIAGNK